MSDNRKFEKVSILAGRYSDFQNEHASAIKEGFLVHGIEATVYQHRGCIPRDSDLVVAWGWRNCEEFRKAGKNVLVMERGYVGDRFKYTSLAFNGLNGHGLFPVYDDKGSRLAALFPNILQPWRGFAGDYVLLIAQVPGDASLRGVDLTSWYKSTAAKASAAYGLPVRFREHPSAIKKGFSRSIPGTIKSPNGTTLEEDLSGAALVITYNSNTGVDAALAGVPVLVNNSGSMAHQMRAGEAPGHDLCYDEPELRKHWSERLACCQWNLDEIRTGYPLAAFVKPPPGE